MVRYIEIVRRYWSSCSVLNKKNFCWKFNEDSPSSVQHIRKWIDFTSLHSLCGVDISQFTLDVLLTLLSEWKSTLRLWFSGVFGCSYSDESAIEQQYSMRNFHCTLVHLNRRVKVIETSVRQDCYLNERKM